MVELSQTLLNLPVLICRLRGDVVQVETWISASGKHGHTGDWLVRDYITGETHLRATSSRYLMIDKKTRKLSFLKEAWADQIKPHVLDCHEYPIIMGDNRKLLQILDVDTADYVRTGLSPLWNDLDINQYVNYHIKYISWILEGAPRSFLESHKLSAMTVEYRKECGRESMLHNLSAVSRNGTSATNSTDHFTEDEGIEFDHSLYLQDGSEVLRARTMWMPKSI
ncbi:hypothetical protein F2P56_028100 [Juglans regia]|uniref:Acyl-[acyl-carrier-protein] hydrolase n=1 Tax=Juglans regia TaxID=51240 RepID=A0A833UJU3_JUGRE|nr:hypothetical protein F2P56_028100 [Juglans regia]